ncbi:T9SS type A sorting domain-containing protein [candidate division WOR-3 bacterium]|uniref:T9SS type A sorting domain-containing protein n=1 Tax=candidate division WOR-3 bacterium TaxID=2052148 RepID=A0A9D5KB32_UNCW3|nr:T9SS type A sorting domain-containing protein [candidate division WOR-3 bacterium]MBD3365618.1 T9SS type A sorting domain-containing protein [candidate division WOR-3 bacterium]
MIWLSVILSLLSAGETERGVTCEVNPTVELIHRPSIDWTRPSDLRTVSQFPAETTSQIGFHILIPAQTAYVLRCDPGKMTVSDTLVPDYGLTSDAEAAITASPRWLRLDLTDNLMRLSQAKQNTIADMILNPLDPRLRDEIAFQAAHISYKHLQSMNLSVITENLNRLFDIDEELGYVEIVDYGDPQSDDDYYSTTSYKGLDDGDTVTYEIPYSIYYWYVIHPRITDEFPKIIYDKFWREFLYYDNGTTSYTAGVYPLLQDALSDIEFVWDGQRHVWPADRELSADMGAINAIGWWVSRVLPLGAQPVPDPRPIQPSEIATDHDGNCGECQDLFCAGLRTGLIPALGVMDINEDHVWNAFWWPTDAFGGESGWFPCQVDLGGGVTHAADSGCAYDKDRGGGKYCSMIWNWRGDGYQFSSVETYSNSCTLSVHVYDTKGKPVGNGEVDLKSERWQGASLIKGYSGITNREGVFTTTLGEEQNYEAEVLWEKLGVIIDSASAIAGSHHVVPCTLSSDYNPQARELVTEQGTYQPREGTSLSLQVDSCCDLGHCPTYSYEEVSSESAVKFAPGKLTDFFITDLEGLEDFLAEQEFTTYGHFSIEGEIDTTLDAPLSEVFYLVFFNNHADMEEAISGRISVTGEPEMLAVDIPVLQNPLLSQYADIWVVPINEELAEPPEVTVTINGEGESVELEGVAETFNYMGGFKFTRSGTATVEVAAGDTLFSRTFNVSQIASSGGSLTSLDGVVQLEVPESCVESSTFFTIIPASVTSGKTAYAYAVKTVNTGRAVGPAYRIGPSGDILSTPVTLRFSYSGYDLVGADPSTLAVMRYLDGEWFRIPCYIDRNNSVISATVDRLGTFQVTSDFRQHTPDLPSMTEVEVTTNYPSENDPLISFAVAREVEVSVEVFDASGRKVSTLAKGNFSEGEHVIRWKGTDMTGKSLAKGIYFCRLRTPEIDETLKLIHLH